MTDRSARTSRATPRTARRLLVPGLLLAGLVGLVYLAATASGGVADPTDAAAGSLSRGTVVL
ncbi:MAG TPA: hypothetical protein VFU94_00205, partial [Conexibacter sp.]|nr:hypothetical protein [Conexibacter sp.]